MADKEFYDIWENEDKPIDDQALALESAKMRAKKYNLDGRIYIVRGYDVFVVHSDDIKMIKQADGTRNIEVKGGRMIKYAEDGKRQTD